jgi:hypothetical protein
LAGRPSGLAFAVICDCRHRRCCFPGCGSFLPGTQSPSLGATRMAVRPGLDPALFAYRLFGMAGLEGAWFSQSPRRFYLIFPTTRSKRPLAMAILCLAVGRFGLRRDFAALVADCCDRLFILAVGCQSRCRIALALSGMGHFRSSPHFFHLAAEPGNPRMNHKFMSIADHERRAR